MKRWHKPYFKKPEEICSDLTEEFLEKLKMNRFSFNRWLYDDLLEKEKEFGVVLRAGKMQDIPNLKKFTEKHIQQLDGNGLTVYDYYRFTEFGHTMILEKDGEMIGSIFEIGYDTPERTSYALRFAIDPAARGKSYALMLTDSACLKALERGSSIIRAVIAVENDVSLFFHLNKVGMVIESMVPEIEGLARFYSASLPISPRGIFENRIDRRKVTDFMERSEQGVDYWLYDSRDFEGIEEALIEHKQKFVAFMPAGDKRFNFLALTSKQIQFFYENQ